ncbi:MAG: murein biosynthesis integral membrane protein MurJ [Chloroflexota bacterium]
MSLKGTPLGNVQRAVTGRWRELATGSINRRIFSAAVIVALLTGCLALATLARELIVASTFGTGDAVDAFLIAFLLPTFLMNVIAGSMSSVFIPAYVRVREAEGHVQAQRLFSSITLLSACLLVTLALLLAVAGPFLLPLLGSGFGPAKLLLTQQLFYVLLPGIVLYGMVSIWGAVLNASERFALVAFTPALVPLTVIVLLLVGRPWGITAMAVGTLAGYVVQMVVLGMALRRNGMSIMPRWDGTHPAVKQVVSQYLPMAGGAVLMSSTLLVDQSLAATLGSGSVAALGYGNKIVVLVLALGATAVRTAVLPYFSGMVARGEWPAVRHTLRTYIGLILLAALPLAIVLALFAEPMVQLLFQRGAFTAENTALVSRVQSMYALQIPFYILASLVTPLISSLRENRVLLWSAAISLSLDIGLDLLFMRLFGVAGIALSTSVIYIVSWAFVTLFCYRIIRRREFAQ